MMEFYRTAIILITICSTCLILPVIEIVLFARSKLKRTLFLVFQVVKTALWIIIVGIETANYARQSARYGYQRGVSLYISVGVEVFMIIVLSVFFPFFSLFPFPLFSLSFIPPPSPPHKKN